MEQKVSEPQANGSERSRRQIAGRNSQGDPVGRLLKIEDVCELLGLSRTTVYRCIKDRAAPFPRPLKIGKCSRWSEGQIIEWKKALIAD